MKSGLPMRASQDAETGAAAVVAAAAARQVQHTTGHIDSKHRSDAGKPFRLLPRLGTCQAFPSIGTTRAIAIGSPSSDAVLLRVNHALPFTSFSLLLLGRCSRGCHGGPANNTAT